MKPINRRDFLKIAAAGAGALLIPKRQYASGYLPDFPTGERLGRCLASVDVLSKPDFFEGTVVKSYFQDNVINLYRDVLGTNDSRLYRSTNWYETDEGYVYAPNVQPVRNLPNEPLSIMPTYQTQPGFWAEVTIPYVDLTLQGENPQSLLLQELLADGQTPRFYYSQVLWIDNVKTGDFGELLYHVLEKHGNTDTFWADARAFKPLTPDDLSPISPDVADKRIVVDVTHQSISCYEGTREIFYGVVSTGTKFTYDGAPTDAYKTPVGDYYAVNRKFVSLHMAGGDSKASGYEEFAVSYTSIFATGGVSFHSTYWHNAYGTPQSHGCVNMKPEEAKFLYRWTQPGVPYEEGKYEQEGYDGTKVQVIEYS